MDAELEAYDTAWKTTPKDERNAVCEALADAYCAAHPELEAAYGALTIPELVALVDIARAAGDDEKRIRLDIYIMSAREFQVINGKHDPGGQHREPLPAININGDRRMGG